MRGSEDRTAYVNGDLKVSAPTSGWSQPYEIQYSGESRYREADIPGVYNDQVRVQLMKLYSSNTWPKFAGRDRRNVGIIAGVAAMLLVAALSGAAALLRTRDGAPAPASSPAAKVADMSDEAPAADVSFPAFGVYLNEADNNASAVVAAQQAVGVALQEGVVAAQAKGIHPG